VIVVLDHSQIIVDSNGNEIRMEGAIEDITERKLAEEARRQAQDELQRERNQLRILIDNLPDLIYFKDLEGHYVLNNRAHLRSSA